MRTTYSIRYAYLFIFIIACSSVASVSYWLFYEAKDPLERTVFLLAGCISAGIALWLAVGISITYLLVLRGHVSLGVQKLWIFKPIIISLVGTSAIATPSFASEIAVEQTDNSLFFQEQTNLTDSGFFPESSAPTNGEAVQEPQMRVLSVSLTGTRTPSQDANIFFRDNNRAENEPIEDSLASHEHVVLRGETLWDIAQENLPSGSSNQEIFQKTYQIFDLNKDQLSSIDSLIYPGQRLRLPSTKTNK